MHWSSIRGQFPFSGAWFTIILYRINLFVVIFSTFWYLCVIYCHCFLFLCYFCHGFSRPVRSVSPKNCMRRDYPSLLHTVCMRYSIVFFYFGLLWPGPLRSTLPPTRASFHDFLMLWLVKKRFLYSSIFQVAKGQSLLKTRFLIVMFMSWDWKLNNYDILVCSLSHTFHFSMFEKKSKHNS